MPKRAKVKEPELGLNLLTGNMFASFYLGGCHVRVEHRQPGRVATTARKILDTWNRRAKGRNR